MTYVKHALLLAASLCLAALLSSCGGAPVKPVDDVAEENIKLIPTLDFIPVLQADKDGVVQLYEAMPNPYIKRGKVRKASVASYIEARRAFKAEDYEKAEKILAILVEEDDSISGPWVMRGDIALNRSDVAQAKEYFTRALEINSDNINAWLKLAYAQRLEGKFLLAQNTYAQVLALWKDCPEAHLNLAILYDIYLNLPLRAQKHMEAYLFLTENKNETVANWLQELQNRTGAASALPLDKPMLKPLS